MIINYTFIVPKYPQKKVNRIVGAIRVREREKVS